MERIQKGPLRELVRVQIKDLMLTNRLHPGKTIVIDRLADELGVSHTPVREALAVLAQDGLVSMKPYKNPCVAEISVRDVREVWEMRLLLEGWAAGKAALGLSEEALNIIESSLARVRARMRYNRITKPI